MLSSTVRSRTSVISWKAVWMPRRCAARGESSRASLPKTLDAALVGQHQAGQQLDDGRLAGAVLAEQRMDRARARSRS